MTCLYYKPRIDKEILAECSDGLVVLSGCLSGEIPRWLRQSRLDKACEAAEWYAKTFGDRFYLELQDNRLHSPINDALRDVATIPKRSGCRNRAAPRLVLSSIL